MDKKTILAVLLTALVLFAYQFYIATYYPAPSVPGISEGETGKQVIDNPTKTFKKPEKQDEEILDKESTLPVEDVVVETEKYIVTLSDEGGCIKSIVLKEYPHPTTNKMFKLVDIGKPEEGIFSISHIGSYDLSRARFNIDKKDSGKEVVFSKQLENGLSIVKKYIFPPSSYNVNLEIYFHNPTNQEIESEYSIVASSNIDIATKLDRRYTQFVSDISGKVRRDNGKKDYINEVVRYTGLQNKYFSVIAKPFSVATKGARLQQIEKNNLLSIIEIDKFKITPNASVSHNFLLYAGPTKKEIMGKYDLGSAINYGFFGGISEILMAGLSLFQRMFKNWGVAIILLAACVNLLLFPLSRKGYESMKKMQELQPHMERLKNEHKDNPNKLNKEIMELYKKYNVNPMGGCLPMALQIPIFVALYQALMRSIELRGARFLWIKDLSTPDAVNLAFNIPGLGNTINILPILMAGAMLFQQHISTKQSTGASVQAKQQQQMMIIMPVLFLFIMYNFPSGLVLYWLINTLLTVLEQHGIMYR